MADGTTMTVQDVVNATEQLHADLLTAKAAEDAQIVHASIIAAVEGLLGCVRTLAGAITRIEVEGVGEEIF